MPEGVCICGRCHLELDPLHEPVMMEVPILEDTFPVVLYLGSEEDREDLIQAVMEIKPNMVSKKL